MSNQLWLLKVFRQRQQAMSKYGHMTVNMQKKSLLNRMKDVKFICAFYNLSAFVVTTCVMSSPSIPVTLANIQSTALIHFKAEPMARRCF